MAAAVALLVVGGVVALFARGSGGDARVVSGASVPANRLAPADPVEAATTTTERPRVETTPRASTTTTSTTPLEPAPTSVADVVLVGPPVPSTTTRSRTVTTTSPSATSPSTTLSTWIIDRRRGTRLLPLPDDHDPADIDARGPARLGT
jgi:hypothetical protein